MWVCPPVRCGFHDTERLRRYTPFSETVFGRCDDAGRIGEDRRSPQGRWFRALFGGRPADRPRRDSAEAGHDAAEPVIRSGAWTMQGLAASGAVRVVVNRRHPAGPTTRPNRARPHARRPGASAPTGHLARPPSILRAGRSRRPLFARRSAAQSQHWRKSIIKSDQFALLWLDLGTEAVLTNARSSQWIAP